MNGYIQLHRSILDWEWYRNKNTKIVFLHLMLIATYKETRVEGVELQTGQVYISIRELAEQCNLTRYETETAIEHLIETGEIRKENRKQKSVITLVRYGFYQFSEQKNRNRNRNCSETETETETETKTETVQKSSYYINNNNKNNNINKLNNDCSLIRNEKAREALMKYHEAVRRKA